MKKALLTYSLFLITYTLFAQIDSTTAFHYKTDKYDCAIFFKKFTDAYNGGNHFSPTRDDIDKAERVLEQKLLLVDTSKQVTFIYKNLKKYQRQYFGYINKEGHKVLYINLLWTEDKSQMKDWLSRVVEVDGGGAYYWKIKYDMNTDGLYDLQVNSED
jgi:hypothetical protein